MSGTADFVYNPIRARLPIADFNWMTAAVNCMLVSAAYSPSRDHTTVSDIPADAIIARDHPVTAKGVTASGVCYGTIASFEALLSDTSVRAMVLYVLGADDDHSPLVYYSSTGSGFPFLPEGFDYLVSYDLLNGGWFQG